MLNVYESIKDLSTTHFCDAGATKILSPLLQPMTKNKCIFGKAFTVSSQGDLIPVIRAIEEAPKDSVLLISTGGSKKAIAGEIFATAAAKKGIVGIVIDGFCRDVTGIANTNIPFFAKGIYPQAGTKEIEGYLNIPISVNGHLINPNDYILSDESGLIVMNEVEIYDLLPIAQSICLKENSAIEILKNGDNSLKDILNYTEHLKAIRNQDDSQLQWNF